MVRLSIPAILVLLLPTTSAEETPIPAAVRSILSQRCADCHSGDSASAGLVLDQASIDWSKADSGDHWEQVHTMVSKDIMPPPDSDPLSDQQRTKLLSWLDTVLMQNSPIGGTPLRRLSRREYATTIQSVFELKNFTLPDSFPPDNTQHGFDNQGEALVIAVSHLEAFAETAATVADEFFAPPRVKLSPAEWSVDPQDLVISYSSACLIDGAMRLASSGSSLTRHGTWPARFEAPANGQYSIEITASAFRPGGEPLNLRAVAAVGNRPEKGPHHDIVVSKTKPQTFRFDMDLDRGQSIGLRYSNGTYDYDDKKTYAKLLTELFAAEPKLAAAWSKIGKPARGGSGWERVKQQMQDPELNVDDFGVGSDAVAAVVKSMASNSVASGETLVYRYFEQGPAINIHGLKISGPHTQPPDRDDLRTERQRKRLLSDHQSPLDHSALQGLFADLLTKAFRRTATAAEIDSYTAMVESATLKGGDQHAALHLAIRTALISPAFLYRNIGPAELDDFQLATRLAYFLTSGPPDKKLHELAGTGKLDSMAVLHREAKRIIGRTFAEDFTAQWLHLDVLNSLMPDPRLMANFKTSHRNIMRDEVARTFDYVLDKNLPITDFIAPDFLFTDPQVGWLLYGLPQFEPTKKNKKTGFDKNIQQVTVARDGLPGGLLSMPAIMMATANGVDTQPVLRGVWMLENILGSPPPDPPDAVPALTPDITGASTPKARLAAHMAEQNCAVCHKEIDPLGFVFENYDPVGRWRDHYPVYVEDPKTEKSTTTDGAAIDATGVLPNGVPLKDVTDLKRWLAANPQPFARCLSEKLLTYATGRTLNYRERRIVADIVEQQMANDLRFRDLLLALIDSPVFRAR